MQLCGQLAGQQTVSKAGGRICKSASRQIVYTSRQRRFRSRVQVNNVGTDRLSSDTESKEVALKSYLGEVRRFLDKTDDLLKSPQDLPTSLSARLAQTILQIMLKANEPPPPPPAPAAPVRNTPDYSSNYSGSSFDSSAYGQDYGSGASRSTLGGSTFASSGSASQQQEGSSQNPQVAAGFKLAKAILFGLSTSLLFGTLPFIDFLQAPEGRELAQWSLWSAAYLWAILTLVRIEKLSSQQPFRLLPDETEVTTPDSNILEIAFTAFTSSLASGFVFRGAWLVLFASTGDTIASMDPGLRGVATQTGVVIATAVAEGSWRLLVTSKQDARAASTDGGYINGYDYRGGGAAAVSKPPASSSRLDLFALEVILSILLTAETLSTGSLVGSVATQTTGMIVAALAAKGGWMAVKDIKK